MSNGLKCLYICYVMHCVCCIINSINTSSDAQQCQQLNNNDNYLIEAIEADRKPGERGPDNVIFDDIL